MLKYLTIPGCKHRCQSQLADWASERRHRLCCRPSCPPSLAQLTFVNKSCQADFTVLLVYRTFNFTAACDMWMARTSAVPPFDVRQKCWDLPLVAAASATLLTTAPNQAAVARLTAVSAPHAGAFLHAVPITACGTRLDDRSLRIAIALRLGAPVCAEHRCICGAVVDVSGTHGLSCRKSAGRLARHNAVNELIRRALLTAEIPSRLEPSKLSHSDHKRPDGVSTMP